MAGTDTAYETSLPSAFVIFCPLSRVMACLPLQLHTQSSCMQGHRQLLNVWGVCSYEDWSVQDLIVSER